MISLYRILLLTTVTRGRLLVFVAAGALIDLIAYSIRVSAYGDREFITVALLDAAALPLFVPVVSLVFSTSTLGDLASDGTLVYFWLRPVARWRVVLVALAATLSITLPLALTPLWLAVVLAGASLSVLWAVTVAVPLACLAYTSVFLGVGLRVRHGLIIGLGYVILWETAIASIGKGPAALSVRHYAEGVFVHLANTHLGSAQATFAVVDVRTGLLVLVSVAVAGLAATTFLLDRQDVA